MKKGERLGNAGGDKRRPAPGAKPDAAVSGQRHKDHAAARSLACHRCCATSSGRGAWTAAALHYLIAPM